MPKKTRTQKQLVTENKDLHARLDEAEETLRAIRSGEVDALVVPGEGGEHIFTLKGANRLYRVLIEDMSEGALTLTMDSVILYANRRFAEMLKTPLEKVIGSTIHTWIAPDSQRILQSLLRKGADEKRREELALTASDGTQVPVYLSVNRMSTDETPASFCLVATDLTEHKRNEGIVAAEKSARELLAASNQSRLALLSVIEAQKRAEQALRESEQRFRSLIENASDLILILNPDHTIAYVSPSVERILGYTVAALVGAKVTDFIYPQDLPDFIAATEHRARTPGPSPFSKMVRVRHADGSWRTLEGMGNNLLDLPGVSGLVINARDITERKRAEEALRESEEKYRKLFTEMSDGFALHEIICDEEGNAVDYITLEVNHAFELLLNAPRAAVVGKKASETLPPPELKHWLEIFAPVALTGKSTRYAMYSPLNQKYFEGTAYCREKGKFAVIFADITERKRAEEAQHESEEQFRSTFEQAAVGMAQVAPDGRWLRLNQRLCGIVGYTREELLTKSFQDITHPDDLENDVANLPRMLANEIQTYAREKRYIRKDGSSVWVNVTVSLVREPTGTPKYFVSVIEDITERKRAEERIQRQFEHLTALSVIDRVITSSFDLRLSFSEILNHVTTELGIDAADILVLNSSLQMLEFSAGRGFRTKAAEKAQVRLGESHAGRAALERQLVQIPNLKDQPDNLLLSKHLAGEGFVCYYGVPLIAKGQVKGVLEVFHRTSLEPDAEWLDFLKALAEQAAIAIDNATLFERLQRSNSELALAYDATIEGWSRALDLRDKETEGHSQRVTEITLRLAKAMGIGDAELAHIRRGALLHDIGKLGVPDSILLKPDKLTDAEWVTMCQHPQVAYDLLSPISYLHAALNIPYCHHEKWDGTGYPRGLKGEQIPLVARIFAIADVWDALRSDRPYRPAWDEDKVRAHILAGSGTHFDPKVVEAFLEILRWTGE